MRRRTRCELARVDRPWSEVGYGEAGSSTQRNEEHDTINADSAALGERKVVLLAAQAISYLVYLYLIFVEIILLMGFVLLLFGATPLAARQAAQAPGIRASTLQES